jgi:hypothetical protein
MALEPSFGGMAVGAGIASASPATTGTGTFPTTIRRKKKSSMMGTVIVLGGIVVGGVLGLFIGLVSLIWIKGPQLDFIGLREKPWMPSWILPAEPDKSPKPTPAPSATPSTGGGESAAPTS